MKFFILALFFFSESILAKTPTPSLENFLEKNWENEDALISMGKKLNRKLKGTPFWFSWSGKKYQGFSLPGKIRRLQKALKVPRSFDRDLELLSLFRSTRSTDLFCYKSLADAEFNLHQLIYNKISNQYVRDLILFHFQYQQQFGVDIDGYRRFFYTPMLTKDQLNPKDDLIKELINGLSGIGNSKNCADPKAVVLQSEPPQKRAKYLKEYSKVFPERIFIYLGKNLKRDIENAFFYRNAIGKKKLLFSYHLSEDKIFKSPFVEKNQFSKVVHHPGQIIFDLHHLGLIQDTKLMRKMLGRVLKHQKDKGIIAQNCKRLKNQWQSVCFDLL